MITSNIPLGNKEDLKERLEPKDITVKDVNETEQTLKDGKTKKIIALQCKHPDREETIEIRKVKYLKNNTLVIEGLWLTLDTEGKIAKASALGKLMNFYNITNINNVVGMTLKTSTNEEKYLVIKAYE